MNYSTNNVRSVSVFEELSSYLITLGSGMLIGILLGRICGLSEVMELITPMIGGLFASSLLCLRWHREIVRANEMALKEEMNRRTLGIRSWCEDVHSKGYSANDWVTNRQIAMARRRETCEELQKYYY